MTLGIPKKTAAEYLGQDDSRPLAAGIVFVAPDGDVLLLRRSSTETNYGGHWGLPGGKAEDGESFEDAARRESREEMGRDIDMEATLKLMDRVETPNKMLFSTFASPTEDKFVPALDGEHSGYCWASLDQLPQPLHPSVARCLGDHIGVTGDMKPEDWTGLREGFVKWTREEEDEPEHADDALVVTGPGGSQTNGKIVRPAGWKEGDFGVNDEALAMDSSVRTIDRDGQMHVARTPISKANVCPYWGHEIPGCEELGLDPDKKYQMLRSPEELAKGAKTLNGKQLMIKHVPVDADDHRPYDTVGTTGTDAEFEDPYLYNSIHIHSQDGIDVIEDESQKELSAGYHYTPVMAPGVFKGVPYDGVMTNIHFNHVALVPEGRAGADVLVADSQIQPKEKSPMSKKVLSRFAGASAVAMGFYLKPKLAADAKIDLNAIFDGVSKKNFAEKRVKIAADIKAATKGKLAKDATLDDVTGMLDSLGKTDVEEGADADPNSGLPMNAEELAKKVQKDADPKAKMREFLQGKLSADDMKTCDELMGGEATDESEEDEDGEQGAGVVGETKDGEIPEKKEKGLDKKAMDAAIKANGDAVETRIRQQFAATAEAREFVRPWAGALSMALDSKEAIERAALDAVGVKHKGVHADALRPILEAQPKPGEQRHTRIAQDHSADGNSEGFHQRWEL